MTYLIQWLMATNPNGLSLGPGGLRVEAQLNLSEDLAGRVGGFLQSEVSPWHVNRWVSCTAPDRKGRSEYYNHWLVLLLSQNMIE